MRLINLKTERPLIVGFDCIFDRILLTSTLFDRKLQSDRNIMIPELKRNSCGFFI